MQSGCSQSFLKDSGFFFLVLHFLSSHCITTGTLSTQSVYFILQNFQCFWTLQIVKFVVASHTAIYWICGTTTVFCTSLSSTMCKMTTVSPSVLIHHSHTSSYRVNHSAFWFKRLWVGASWLKKKTTVTSASPTDQQMKGAHQKQFRCLLRTCTHRKSGKPSFRLWPQSFRKVVRPLFDLLIPSQNKEAHKRTEGTPSFWRRQTMFKLWQMSKDSDRPTQTQKETQGAFKRLTLTPFLPTHLSLQKSQPVHVERKASLLWQFQSKRAALALWKQRKRWVPRIWAHPTCIPHFFAWNVHCHVAA